MKNTNLIDKLNNFMNENKLTINKVAEDLGYSRTVISRYINGKYDGNINELENKLNQYMCINEDGSSADNAATKNKMYSIPALLKNDDALEVMGVCESCQKYSEFGMIIGRSGYGKTYVLRKYAASFKKVILIECDDTMSVRDLIEEITARIGMPLINGSNHKKILRIREFFNINKGYLLILDEADKLINKHTQKKLDIIRTLIDDPQTEVGVILSGEPNLETLVRTYLERLANRNEAFCELTGLSANEVKEYLKEFNFDDEALAEMVTRATNSRTGCFRILNRTMKNILRTIERPDELITLDIVVKATKMTLLR